MNKKQQSIFEYALVIILGMITYLLAGYFDLLEVIIEFSHQHEEYELDEILTTSFVISFALLILVIRRSSQLKNEIVIRGKAEKAIAELAYSDPLTKLPNRRSFMARLDYVIKQAERDKSHQALIFIDIDNFKNINDTSGHVAGDALLCAFSDRAKKCLRNNDMIARIAGDEFVVLISNINYPQDAAIIAEKIIEKSKVPYTIQSETLKITLSIGIAITPIDSNDPEQLISYADKAMYKVKQEGKNNLQFFSQQINDIEMQRQKTLSLLKIAIEKQELYLDYQPIYNKQLNIHSLEALIRWNNSELGLVSPAVFIPIAEKNGLISSITCWVINTVCQQLQCWMHQGVRLPQVSVNISCVDLIDPAFADVVQALLVEYDVDPSLLEFEITETSVMKDVSITIPNLEKINKLGIRLAIDDFGSEYSSMSYLMMLPIQTLKIDKIFVDDLEISDKSKSIFNAIVALGKELGLLVITEGVETEYQANFVLNSGSNALQGYYYCKPMAVKDITKILLSQVELTDISEMQVESNGNQIKRHP